MGSSRSGMLSTHFSSFFLQSLLNNFVQIREAYPDVVLLQEVRSSHHNKQLDDLKALLPYLRYSAFAVATPNADFDSAEGLGVSFVHSTLSLYFTS